MAFSLRATALALVLALSSPGLSFETTEGAEVDEAPSVTSVIADLDTSGDAKVTADELEARLIKVRKAEAKKSVDETMDVPSDEQLRVDAREDPNFFDDFDASDTDKDGLISLEEDIAWTKAQAAAEEFGEDKPEELVAVMHSSFLEHQKMLFEASDSNKDGKLTKDEWVLVKSKFYPEIDKAVMLTSTKWEAMDTVHNFDENKDGHLDAGEIDRNSLWHITHPPHLRDEL